MTFAPAQDYHNQHPEQHPSSRDPERRYGFRKSLEAVKAKVKAIDEADLLCGPAGTRTGLRKVGERWVGCCPLPDHADRSPSFTVYPETDSWYCFGCCRGGDVLDLHQLAHGYAEKWEALISLATQRGVELPERPKSWFVWQDEKARRRREIRDAKAQLYQRRYFKLFFADNIAAIQDPEDRRRETEEVWAALQPVCWNIATREILQ